MKSLQSMSVDELRALARERAVPAHESLDRDALVAALDESAPRSSRPRAKDGDSALHPEPLHRRQGAMPTSVLPARPADYDSETMARVYLAQGLAERAVEIFRQLLAARPDDRYLEAELLEAERLAAEQRKDREPPPPPPARTQGEPFGMLDFEELPESYGIDEVEVLFKDPFQVFAYWEITDAGMTAARTRLGEEGTDAKLVLRLFASTTGAELAHTKDYPIEAWRGRRYFPAPRSGARVRAATGLVAPSGLFALIAHSSVVRVPPADPAPAEPAAVEWIEVRPHETRGLQAEPIEIVRRIAAAEAPRYLGDEESGSAVDAEGRPVRQRRPGEAGSPSSPSLPSSHSSPSPVGSPEGGGGKGDR